MPAVSLKVREGDKPGEAIIEVGAPGVTLPDAPLLSIRRRGYDLGELGPGGWQMADAALSPRATTPTPDGALLLVGPEIAQHLERGNYEVAISGPGLAEPLTGVMAWSVRGSAGAVRRRAGRLAASEAGAEETVSPEPRRTIPEVTPDLPEEKLVVRQIVPQEDVDPDEGGQRGQEVPPVPSPLRFWPAASVVALLLVVGGVWLLWPQPKPLVPPIKKGEETALNGKKGTDADLKLGVVPPDPSRQDNAGGNAAGPTPPPAPQLSPVEQARQFLEGKPSPAATFAKATDFQNQGSMDAAVPLFRFAADGGEARAADALGRLYDPANLAPPGVAARRTQMPDPNPLFAAMWYKRGTSAGDPTAAQDLRNLQNWAQARAAQGDQAAAELLAKLQP